MLTWLRTAAILTTQTLHRYKEMIVSKFDRSVRAEYVGATRKQKAPWAVSFGLKSGPHDQIRFPLEGKVCKECSALGKYCMASSNCRYMTGCFTTGKTKHSVVLGNCLFKEKATLSHSSLISKIPGFVTPNTLQEDRRKTIIGSECTLKTLACPGTITLPTEPRLLGSYAHKFS